MMTTSSWRSYSVSAFLQPLSASLLFLHRFCKLHPPSLLGFYIDVGPGPSAPRFITMLPEPPELTAVIRRVASYSLGSRHSVWTYTRDCGNGRLIITRYVKNEFEHEVHSPMSPYRVMAVLPRLPSFEYHGNTICFLNQLLSVEEGGRLSYLHVLVKSDRERTKSTVYIHRLQPADGFWRKELTLAIDQICNRTWWIPKVVLVRNKIYIARLLSAIIVLDLVASSFSTIELPQGVDDGTIMLSRADDASAVYLMHVKELQLCTWLNKGDNWLLVDTICLHKMCANLRMSENEQTDVLQIKQVGDNAEFVFFQMGRCVLFLDVKCRTLRKVYDIAEKDRCSAHYIYPLKMTWPPIFPELKDNPSRFVAFINTPA